MIDYLLVRRTCHLVRTSRLRYLDDAPTENPDEAVFLRPSNPPTVEPSIWARDVRPLVRVANVAVAGQPLSMRDVSTEVLSGTSGRRLLLRLSQYAVALAAIYS